MRCTQCQLDNQADAAFCQDCGTKLEAVCSACQAANSASSRFCRMCGVRLESAAAVAAASTTAAPAKSAAAAEPFVPAHLAERFRLGHAAHLSQHVDERKIITALFADIKGSMALLDQMDPERARAVIDPALRLMINAVYRYQGYVAQSLGDGIFALFGAPIAREDHARRALYSALSMQEQMKAYGQQLQSEHGLPAMQIRIGVNTGEVVVRSIATDEQRADYVPVGHSTGLAARIEGLAAPGSILVSESTQRLTEGFFAFRSLGPVPMKGVSAPVTLFEVTGIGPLRTRLEVSASHGLSRFVGRTQELALMQQCFEQARGGQGQILSLVGEAGVGKSRLCHEFKQSVARDCLVLECSSDSYGKAFPFLPLIDLLRHYLHVAPGDEAHAVLEKVTGRILALDRALDDVLPFLLALLGVDDPAMPINRMDPQIRRRRTFEAIERLVLREAQRQPVLMVIEDLHWIDIETQAFIDSFAARIGDARLMLLCNHRPEYRSSWGSNVSDQVPHQAFRLAAFGPAEAQALLDSLLGEDAGLARLKALITEKTQGNPFFMEEYVQTLFDQGDLVREAAARGEKVTLMRSLSSIDMPATVQGVLAARIDRLAPEHKTFLQLLAVMGQASELSLIERITGTPAAQLQALLEALQSAEFIFERPAFPETEYVFKHALTRETAYSELLAAQRRALHTRAAVALEAHHAQSLDEHNAELADHYSRSDDPAKAVHFLLRAAAQAMQRSAYALAIDHLLASQALLPRLADAGLRNTHERKLQVMLGAAWTATRGFAVPEAAAAYERARVLCAEDTPSAELISAYAGLGLLHLNHSDLARARSTGEELLRLAEQRIDPDLLVSGHQLLGLTFLRTGELQPCLRHMALAVRHCADANTLMLRTSLGADPAVMCLSFGSMGLWLAGHPDQAMAQAAQALRDAHSAKQRHPFTLAFALLSSAWVRHFRREVTATLLEAQAAVEFATDHGFPAWLAHGLVLQGWAEAELGRCDAGLALISRGLVLYESTGATVWTPFMHLLQAQALGHGGNRAGALEAANRGLSLAQEIGPYWWTAELIRVRGELLAADAPIHEDALRCFERAQRLAHQQGARALELRASASRLRLVRAMHPPHSGASAEEASDHLAAVLAEFNEGLDTPDLVQARALLEDSTEITLTETRR